MSVEKRSRPTSTAKTGVIVPCSIACTAIGREGVAVASLVAVVIGDGVITKKVGLLWAAAGLVVARLCAVGEDVSDGWGLLVWAGDSVVNVPLPRTVRAMAIKAKKNPRARDQRVRTA
jgi:hypothetical protein